MSEIGVFVVRTVYCEITGRGCLHPSAWRQNSYAAKNPRTNVRGFCLDVTKKIPCLKIHPIFCLLF